MKIVVGVLNHNRFPLLHQTLSSIDSLFSSYKLKFVLHDNNPNPEEKKLIKGFWGHMFDEIIWSNENIGIGGGVNSLHDYARDEKADFYLHLENDWEMVRKKDDLIDTCVEYFKNIPKLGIIKLRKENDKQYEMTLENYKKGISELYSPWWLEKIPNYVQSLSLCGELLHYAEVERGYTNNPHILRMDMIEDWRMKDDVKGKSIEEELWELKPKREGWKTGCFQNGFFKHIG